MLVSSQCDAAAGLTESFSRFCEENPGFRVVEGTFSKVPQAIAVHRRCVHASTFLPDFIQQYCSAGKPSNEAVGGTCEGARSRGRDTLTPEYQLESSSLSSVPTRKLMFVELLGTMSSNSYS